MSFESLSRGATRAVAVDSSKEVVAALRENAATLGAQGFEAHRAGALEFLGAESRRFEVIFLDPPFDEDWLPRLWQLLPQRMSAGGLLYVEQSREVEPPAGWRISHHRKAGHVHYHLLRFDPECPPPEESS